jgi:NAD(P)-dependent dehydrogenase (short-subunit alcohol dehydrogenase family)
MHKSILIFGASKGLGRATAEHFANNGWLVFAVARDQELLDKLSKSHSQVRVKTCDVTNESDVAEAYAWATRESEIDAILLTAGGGFITDVPLEKTDAESLRKAFEVNAIGTFHVAVHAKNLFSSQKHGVFVGIGSRGSLNQDVLPERVAYSASKHAQLAIIETLYGEVVGEKIDARIIAVCPGFIPGTDMVREWSKLHQPDKNAGTPLEVAAELLYHLIENPAGYPEFLYLMEEGRLQEVSKYSTDRG